ncbi:MAG: hemolysin family protein, partial [Candidatus Aureabacteria bacterium]|nr:hemolysin family protein [Candidatus Auribacterota bacterium]
MDRYILYHLIGIVILLCCSFYFSCTETTLFSLSGFKIKKLQREHVRRGPLIARLLANPRRLLISILIGNMFVNILASTLGESLMRFLHPGAEGTIMAIFIMSFAILVVGEVTPKTIAIQCNERLAPLVAPVIDAIGIILYPLRRLVRIISDQLIALLSRNAPPTEHAITEDEIKTAIRIGSREGIVDSQEREMIQGVFDFVNLRVTAVMRPRQEMVSFELNHPLPEIQAAMRARRYSRIPIYEGEPDNIIGVLYAKDLLRAPGAGGAIDLRGILRPAFFIPETQTASSLLREFRTRRVHLAIVVDEYGGVCGLVTLEDLLEEIVGEI